MGGDGGVSAGGGVLNRLERVQRPITLDSEVAINPHPLQPTRQPSTTPQPHLADDGLDLSGDLLLRLFRRRPALRAR